MIAFYVVPEGLARGCFEFWLPGEAYLRINPVDLAILIRGNAYYVQTVHSNVALKTSVDIGYGLDGTYKLTVAYGYNITETRMNEEGLKGLLRHKIPLLLQHRGYHLFDSNEMRYTDMIGTRLDKEGERYFFRLEGEVGELTFTHVELAEWLRERIPHHYMHSFDVKGTASRVDVTYYGSEGKYRFAVAHEQTVTRHELTEKRLAELFRDEFRKKTKGEGKGMISVKWLPEKALFKFTLNEQGEAVLLTDAQFAGLLRSTFLPWEKEQLNIASVKPEVIFDVNSNGDWMPHRFIVNFERERGRYRLTDEMLLKLLRGALVMSANGTPEPAQSFLITQDEATRYISHTATFDKEAFNRLLEVFIEAQLRGFPAQVGDIVNLDFDKIERSDSGWLPDIKLIKSMGNIDTRWRVDQLYYYYPNVPGSGGRCERTKVTLTVLTRLTPPEVQLFGINAHHLKIAQRSTVTFLQAMDIMRKGIDQARN